MTCSRAGRSGCDGHRADAGRGSVGRRGEQVAPGLVRTPSGRRTSSSPVLASMTRRSGSSARPTTSHASLAARGGRRGRGRRRGGSVAARSWRPGLRCTRRPGRRARSTTTMIGVRGRVLARIEGVLRGSVLGAVRRSTLLHQPAPAAVPRPLLERRRDPDRVRLRQRRLDPTRRRPVRPDERLADPAPGVVDEAAVCPRRRRCAGRPLIQYPSHVADVDGLERRPAVDELAEELLARPARRRTSGSGRRPDRAWPGGRVRAPRPGRPGSALLRIDVGRVGWAEAAGRSAATMGRPARPRPARRGPSARPSPRSSPGGRPGSTVALGASVGGGLTRRAALEDAQARQAEADRAGDRGEREQGDEREDHGTACRPPRGARLRVAGRVLQADADAGREVGPAPTVAPVVGQSIAVARSRRAPARASSSSARRVGRSWSAPAVGARASAGGRAPATCAT